MSGSGALAPLADRAGDTKARIRSEVAAARNGLAPEEHARRGRDILQRIMAMDAFLRADVVMGYSSFGSEPDTRPLLEAVLARGKTLVLSRIDRHRNRLDLYAVADLAGQLVDGVWGIREPDPTRCAKVEPASLDFVLMPGVAFDAHGGRVGYGKGYYDRLLADCIAAGGCPSLVAGAFDLQVVEHVPMEAHDIAVHAVVTESRCLTTHKDAGLVPRH